MSHLLSLFISGLYVKLRGRTFTEIEPTDNTVNHTHSYRNSDGDVETVLIHCEQFRHTVTANNWFWPNTISYLYKVHVVLINIKEVHKKLPVSYYPHLCADWLHNTTYPHMCAINAYIDDVFGEDDGA